MASKEPVRRIAGAGLDRIAFGLSTFIPGELGLRLSGDARLSGERLGFTRSVPLDGVGEEEGLPFLPFVRVGLPCIRENCKVAFIGPCFDEAGDAFLRTLCVELFDIFSV